jgi:hypothetical protein
MVAFLFLVCFLNWACASFRPSLDQKVLFGGTRIPTVEQSSAGVTLSIEEFASADKSKQAFDSDVIAAGVLPLLFRVDSRNDAGFRIPSSSIKAYLNDQPLETLTGEAAARQAATRDYVGKALGWSVLSGPFIILAWPGTIVGSAVHTRNVNSRIIHHFQVLEFKGAMVRANQPVSGFIYFQVPSDGKLLQTLAETKQLQNLKVEVSLGAEQEAQNINFTIPMPSINLSASAKN